VRIAVHGLIDLGRAAAKETAAPQDGGGCKNKKKVDDEQESFLAWPDFLLEGE